MNDKEILTKIAKKLEGIDETDLSYVEKKIAQLLVDGGYLALLDRTSELEWRGRVAPSIKWKEYATTNNS